MNHVIAQYRRQSQLTRRATPRVESLETRALLSTGYSFAPVAFLGDRLPGPEGGTFVNDFEAGGLNNQGQVVFTADVSTGGEGVFLGGKGGLSQIMRAGESAPGGGTFGGFGSLSPDTINNSGDAAFGFTLNSPTDTNVENAGLYRYDHSSGQVKAVEVPGVTPVPGGAPGDKFAGAYFYPYLSDAGTLTFTGQVPVTGGSLGQGVFVSAPNGQISRVVGPGDTVAHIGTFDQANESSINSKGDVAFSGHLTSDPSTIPAGFTGGVYLKQAPGGQIISIAHNGDPIPASGGGGKFDYCFAPIINARGQVTFIGGVQGTTTGPFGTDALLVVLYSQGSLTAVASPGQLMPGGGHFVTASLTGGGQEDLNNSGDLVFNALLDNGDEGLYLFSHGTLSLVARTGTVIPGVGTIDKLDFFNAGETTSYARLNDHGQVAFGATLVGGGGALLIATPGGTGNSAVVAVSPALAAPAAANPAPQPVLPLVTLPFTEIDQAIQELGGGLLTAKKKS